MKKVLSALLAVMMLVLGAAALADEVPQDEGGKKFEGWWALAGGLIEIDYEEEGYRVSVDLRSPEGTGTLYEYSCYYSPERDRLESISATTRDYTYDAETGEVTDGEVVYGDIDAAGEEAVFAIKDNGALTWTDGRQDSGTGELEFRYIGRFAGTWRSMEGEEAAWVEFTWEGLDEEQYCYSVYLHRGDDETYAEFVMTGLYNEETGKLECFGKNVDETDAETYEAFFSKTEDGKLLYEAGNGIVMEYDLLGGTQG